jgi:CHC2 zinc finger
MSKVDDIKARLTVVELWARLYPNSAPKTGRNWIYKSPFREDKTPSFSIFSGGTRFRDHATGDAGDVISFASLAYGISSKEAIRKLSGEVCALPERRNIAPPTKKPELDVKEYERLVDQCLDGFRLDANTVLHRLLKAKNIPHEIAMSMRNEESLGCHQGCPAYIYDNGIKVRYSAESSRSTRWLIGSDGGLPVAIQTSIANNQQRDTHRGRERCHARHVSGSTWPILEGFGDAKCFMETDKRCDRSNCQEQECFCAR